MIVLWDFLLVVLADLKLRALTSPLSGTPKSPKLKVFISIIFQRHLKPAERLAACHFKQMHICPLTAYPCTTPVVIALVAVFSSFLFPVSPGAKAPTNSTALQKEHITHHLKLTVPFIAHSTASDGGLRGRWHGNARIVNWFYVIIYPGLQEKQRYACQAMPLLGTAWWPGVLGDGETSIWAVQHVYKRYICLIECA